MTAPRIRFATVLAAAALLGACLPAGAQAANTAPVCEKNDGTTIHRSAKLYFACTDAEGDAFDFEVVDGPDHGTLGAFGPWSPGSSVATYSPEQTYTGPDAVTYRAVDAHGAASAPVTLDLDVGAWETAPVCHQFGTVAIEHDTPLEFPGYCIDYEYDPYQFAIVSPPSHGTAVMVDNHFRYTPAAGYVGPDLFRIQATDAQGLTGDVIDVPLMVKAPQPAPVQDGSGTKAPETGGQSTPATTTPDPQPAPAPAQAEPPAVPAIAAPAPGSVLNAVTRLLRPLDLGLGDGVGVGTPKGVVGPGAPLVAVVCDGCTVTVDGALLLDGAKPRAAKARSRRVALPRQTLRGATSQRPAIARLRLTKAQVRLVRGARRASVALTVRGVAGARRGSARRTLRISVR